MWVFPKIGGTPKSSILIGFSSINHPFWGTIIFGNIQMYISRYFGLRGVNSTRVSFLLNMF